MTMRDNPGYVLISICSNLKPGAPLPSLAQLSKKTGLTRLALENSAKHLAKQGALKQSGRKYYKPADIPNPSTAVEQLIMRVRKRGDCRALTCMQISDELGIGLLSVRRAVRLLADDGVVTVKPRLGVLVTPDANSRTARAATKWERIYQKLSRDLVNGVYPVRTQMPAPKELANRYGVDRRTLTKALHKLESDGTILSDRRTYQPASVPRMSTQTVYCFVRGMYGVPVEITSRTDEHFRLLEYEAKRLSIDLQILPYSYTETELLLNNEKSLPEFSSAQIDATLGYMVWTGGLNHTSICHLLRHLEQTRKPVCVFDETEDFRPEHMPGSMRNVRYFGVANSRLAGQEVGQFLLKKGHDTIAFFSPYHNFNWSRLRLEGLGKAFAGPAAIKHYTFDLDQDRDFDFLPELGKLMERLQERHSRRMQIDLMARKAINAITNYSAVLRETWIRDELEPLFEAAYQQQSITAWVGANDRVALQMLSYLQRKKNNRPVAVIGFDNSLDALFNGLTSYGFNGPAIIPAMFAFLLDSRVGRPHQEYDPLEIKGSIIPRKSTSRILAG